MGDRYDNAYDSSPYQEGSTQPPLYGAHAGASLTGGRIHPPGRDDGETRPYRGSRPVLNESDYGQAVRPPSSYGGSVPAEGSYGQPRQSYGIQGGDSLSTASYRGAPQPAPPYGGGVRPPLPYVTLPDSGHESAQSQSGYDGEPRPLKPYPPYGNQEPGLGQTKPDVGYSGGRGIRPQPYENQQAGRGGGSTQLPQPYPPYGIQHPNEDSLSSGGPGRGRGGGRGSQLAPAADPYGRGYGKGQNPGSEYAPIRPIRPSSFEEEEVLPAPISSEVAYETYSSVFADPVYGGARDYNPEGGYSEEPESSRLAHYQQDLHRQNDLKKL